MKKSALVYLLVCSLSSFAQSPYKTGDAVADFAIPKILNYTSSTTSLQSLKGRLTILDFFGTWCVPCIKALPRLKELKQSNAGDIQVILISVEEETKLATFLRKQKELPFPIIVDEKEFITNLFQPPSLPYTVVLNNRGRLLAVTEASEISEEKIKTWLMGNDSSSDKILPAADKEVKTAATVPMNYSNNNTIRLSQEFIYAAKTGEGAALFVERLKNIDYQMLKNSLNTDVEKNAFWINLYNGYTQIFLKANPDQYQDRGKFFGSKKIEIAGKNLSLDDIEHGILRHSKIKWSLGHFNKLFPGKTEKELRVDKVDYRIHFALNCGAKSCPPIAYYAPEKLDTQLELATKNYLTSEAEYKKDENRLDLPAIMGWFRADFGGKKGMKKILSKHGIIAQEANLKMSFKKYDWSLYLDNYKL